MLLEYFNYKVYSFSFDYEYVKMLIEEEIK